MSSIAQPLKGSEVHGKQDPTVAKQFDTETPIEEQVKDYYAQLDNLQIALLGTMRDGQIVTRCMAIGHRQGPDVLFLANKDSNKVKEIKQNDSVNVSVIDTKSTNNWVSIAGKATVSEDKSEIEKCYNPLASAWFGDLGDGVHNGTPDDPRMVVVKVKADYVSYWLQSRTKIGVLTDVVVSAVTGGVATPGPCRELKSADLDKARREASA